MAPGKDVIGITEAELQAVANAYPYDSTGFTAELARRFSVAELQKADAYAHYLNTKLHDHSSLWGRNSMEFWDAADLAKKRRSNPHAIEEWLAAHERAIKSERLNQRLQQLGLALLVSLGFLVLLSIHHISWALRVPATLTAFTIPMAILRTYTWDEITGGVVLLIFASPVLLFFVLML